MSMSSSVTKFSSSRTEHSEQETHTRCELTECQCTGHSLTVDDTSHSFNAILAASFVLRDGVGAVAVSLVEVVTDTDLWRIHEIGSWHQSHIDLKPLISDCLDVPLVGVCSVVSDGDRDGVLGVWLAVTVTCQVRFHVV